MKTPLFAALALAAASAAAAQPYSPSNLPAAGPRAKGPALAPAVEAAQAAVAACAANGYKVSALIVDSAGLPVVLLSGDGAAERTQIIARTKVAVVLKYKATSGEIAARAKTDPALDAALKADPEIVQARQGAVPLLSDGQMIGAFAVSGAPGGEKDEACVHAALDKVGARLK